MLVFPPSFAYASLPYASSGTPASGDVSLKKEGHLRLLYPGTAKSTSNMDPQLLSRYTGRTRRVYAYMLLTEIDLSSVAIRY